MLTRALSCQKCGGRFRLGYQEHEEGSINLTLIMCPFCETLGKCRLLMPGEIPTLGLNLVELDKIQKSSTPREYPATTTEKCPDFTYALIQFLITQRKIEQVHVNNNEVVLLLGDGTQIALEVKTVTYTKKEKNS